MSSRRLFRALACAALAMFAAAVLRAYQQPEFAVRLANATWLCS